MRATKSRPAIVNEILRRGPAPHAGWILAVHVEGASLLQQIHQFGVAVCARIEVWVGGVYVASNHA